MVTIFTQTKILDLAGDFLKDGQGQEVTYRNVLVHALINPQQDDSSIGAEEKLKRYELAKKIYKETEVDLTSEEVVQLKTLIAKNYGALVTGQLMEVLK